ncbi:MAG: NAD(P)H-dependent glycerol-3-phosphate dehydrogenase [Pseudomonadota bacterium]
MSIGVVGAGAWGTALATQLATHQDDVVLWGRHIQRMAAMAKSHRNPAYLGNTPLSPKLTFTAKLDDLSRCKTVLYVAPAQSFSTMALTLTTLLENQCRLVLCAKGMDKTTGRLLHTEAEQHFGRERVFALSGPSFAKDVAQGLPTAVVLAGNSWTTATTLAEQLASPWFRIYASDDLTGVEAGGALKNVMALAVGAARGLGLGASAEAALIARGFAELSRIAVALGARSETLAGLSGLGDLVLTCSSPQSRNFAYGIALARGDDLTNRPLAEGVHTARIALTTAQNHGVDTPIIAAVVDVLEGKLTAREAVSLLLERPLKAER